VTTVRIIITVIYVITVRVIWLGAVREMIEALDGEGQLALVHLLAAIPAAGRSARLAELAALEARRPFREDRAAYMRRWRKRHETGERR